MEWSCLLDEEKRRLYGTRWRKRFAWFPVQVDANKIVWLESFEVRGGRKYADFVEYRYRGVTHKFTYHLEN